MKHKNGHWVWVYNTGQVIEWEEDGSPKRMLGTTLDITVQKKYQNELYEANEKLKRLSYIDSLTQIPNRRAYDERLSHEISSAERYNRPISLLLIDIDSFKGYNDHYGHEKGDIALYMVAQLINNSLQRKVDFFARYGGEEFIVISPSTSIDSAILLAQKILKGVIDGNIEYTRSNFNKTLTISIGIASSNTNFNNLLSNADNALYKAKSNGRNRYEVYNML